MKLVPLTLDYELSKFDCGDKDLNDFLLNDAKPSLQLRIANTYILEDEEGCTAAYFCLLNDKISKHEIIGSRWKKIKSNFPKGKQFGSYPSIKIGRFAVSQNYHGVHLGSVLLDMLLKMFKVENEHSAFRYITVDAYLSAIPFYEKNGFIHLTTKDEDTHTRLMFYDMMEVG